MSTKLSSMKKIFLTLFLAFFAFAPSADAMTQPIFGPVVQTGATSGTTKIYPFMSTNDNGSTEGNFSTPVGITGTVSNLTVKTDVAPGAGTSIVYTLRDGAVDTALTCTISDTNTTCTSAASASVSAGDLLNWRSTVTGTPAATNVSISATLSGTTDDEATIMGLTSGTVGAGATSYFPIYGNGANATVAAATTTMPASGTVDHLYVQLSGTTGGAGKIYDITIYKNGVATALTCRIDNASSCTDLSHSPVSFTAGDSIAVEIIPTGTPTARVVKWGLRFQPTTNGESPLFMRETNISNATAPRFASIRGNGTTVATESSVQALVPIAFTLKNLYAAFQSGAPTAGTSRIFKARKTGADTSLTTTIDSTTAGAWNTDLTAGHAVSYTTTDTINWSIDKTGSPPTTMNLFVSAIAFVNPTVAAATSGLSPSKFRIFGGKWNILGGQVFLR